jgi:ABC-type nitrate/sulfonate/bicarbonate transport system substrate-binding protein
MKTFASAIAVTAAVLGSPAHADPALVTIVVFNPPSLGSIFPSVIKTQKFDIANGLDIRFVERPPDAYAAQFNSGEFEVGGSASVLIVGLGTTRGIKTSYLFNLFDYWGTVVTNRPEIKAYASVKAERPATRTIDLNIAKVWHAFTGGSVIPYLGVAAHQDWIDKHHDLIPGLYRAYKQAAAWVMANPAVAAPLVASVKDDAERQAIAAMIRDNARLGLDLQPAGRISKEIAATYRAGLAVGLLKEMPPASSIYTGEME